jgi:formiminoglutamase
MMSDDPQWPRASQWLASGTDGTDLAVIGVPLNDSITPGRCDLAPSAIRAALERFSTYDVDLAVDVADLAVKDFGDADAVEANATCAVLLGGDNNVARVGLQSLGVAIDRCGLLTFDAHHDVRDTSGGFHNGNPVRALLEAGLIGQNVIQIGIQPFANSRSYSQFALENGIGIVTVDDVYTKGLDTVVSKSLAHLAANADAVYVDLDLDVLDRAFAPACAGARPGGLPPWMVRQAARLCGKAPIVRMMDIVEVDPTKDINDITSMAAASFLLAFAAGLTTRLRT